MHSVVVIDDDAGIREALQEFLAVSGYAVRTADGAVQGLAMLREDPDCCLVLLDYRMPEIDGFECLRAMRADPLLATLPVILMSAQTIGVPAAHAAGARFFIQKPVDPDVLTRLVDLLTVLVDLHCQHRARAG